ncbi:MULTISPECIES: CocE/NonD family hydrolase [Mycobacterium]|uniref:Hydrolase n=1 Tax=Mycobacterium kiyosense TaxID=2871094 RepID=A0A9P3Q4T3_9MYCO|nr:hydrolase [Mycobacterium kiyosense]BDE13363.1 hydrolase [Mycobacterium sp. 20KCMC460]GLB92300.1 hydrolase [Mycobacterium kiyosense]GLB98284.1 hydrolase [Mycobacterium kiyosense]GLC01410.1 hydrolase [Mycobacterium kiyosense]
MSTTSTEHDDLKLRDRAAGVSGRVALGALGRALHLPRATTRYTRHHVQVPMRDGVHLVADHYAPLTPKPAGTLLTRGPYGRRFPFSLAFARLYAARGYHVVLQSVRGTFGSAGQFEPMVNEAADGADTVQWLREQPWFTGSFATIGLSYLGFTQWALLQDPPPELATAVITVGPHDFRESVWGTGTFAVNDFLGWSAMVARQEEPGLLRAGIRQLSGPRKVARALAEVPMGKSARALLGEGAPWFESWVDTHHGDPFWDQLRFPDALDRVNVPVLLLSGWQDIFLRQTLQQYRHLRDRGIEVGLTIGPWTHTQMLTKGLATCTRETLDWLDTHLGGATAPRRPSPAHIFVTGQGWRHLADWPPATTEHALYLQPYGHLGDQPPTTKTRPANFHYDPAHPTPTIGGPLLSPKGGYRDDTKLAMRDDVLSFTGATLTHDLFVYGNPVIELEHSADNPNVDLFVRVSEVDAKGRSRNLSDGYRRLGPLEPGTHRVRIELDAVAHRFAAGSRVRVLITGSWFPRYARNLGTEEPMLTARQHKPATHSVHFGESRLLLPVGRGSADRPADAGDDAG